MNKRFVFESFQEFLDYAETLNEGLEFPDASELQRRLSEAGAPEEVLDAISAVNELCKKTSVDPDDDLAAFEGVRENGLTSESLKGIAKVIGTYTRKEKTEIVSIEVEEQDIKYGNMVGGTVVSEEARKWNSDYYDEDSDRVPLANLLSWVNIRNLRQDAAPSIDSEEERFSSSKSKDYIRGGVMGQHVLANTVGQLSFDKNEYNGELFKSWARPINEDFTKVTPNSEPKSRKERENWAKTNSNTFILYYPTSVEAGKGAKYKSTEIIQYERPVAKTEETFSPISIENVDDVLFEVNKSVLKDEGKAAIMQALSNVAAAKTIKITGGASIEGSREWNEELCQKRAKAVEDFLRAGPFKNAKITISDKADIQESGTPDETRRRVILDITGEKMVKTTESGTETVFEAQDLANKADLVTIKQVAIKITGKWI